GVDLPDGLTGRRARRHAPGLFRCFANPRVMKSPLSSLIWLSVRPLLRLRARRLARLIASELGAGDRVLDVGCGDLGIGKEVRKIVDVSWTGVDVLDYAFGYEQVEGLDFQK